MILVDLLELAPPFELYSTAGDTTPPATPSGLAATNGDGQVRLDWDASGASDLADYQIYHSTSPSGPFAVLTTINSPVGFPATTYTHSGLVNGSIHYYKITARDAVGNESAQSSPAVLGSPAGTGTDFTTTDTSYLTVAEADAIAANLPGLASFKAATTGQKAAALIAATMEIDAAGPWQGRKYDLWTPQTLEFPRVPYESAFAVVQSQFASLGAWLGSGFAGVQIWDWDRTSNAAIVPAKVKTATLYQADALIKGTLKKVLDDLAKGLSAQATGSLSESYRDPSTLAGALIGASMGLCREAGNLMRPYRLASGRLL